MDARSAIVKPRSEQETEKKSRVSFELSVVEERRGLTLTEERTEENEERRNERKRKRGRRRGNAEEREEEGTKRTGEK